MPTPSIAGDPPDAPSDGNKLQAWQTLFEERSAWSINFSEESLQIADMIRKLDGETRVVHRSAAIAVENVKQHVGNLRPKFEDITAWAHQIMEDQTFLFANWKNMLDSFSHIPVSEALGGCLQGSQKILQEGKSKKALLQGRTLNDFVNVHKMTTANDTGRDIARRFKVSVDDLTNAFEKVSRDAHQVIDSFSRGIPLPDGDSCDQVDRLMEEIEVIVKKINGDYEFILRLPNTQETISQVSRTALLHTRNLIPSLLETKSDIDQLLHSTTKRKKQVMISAVKYMQKVSALESVVAQVHAQLAGLGVEIEDGNAFDMLNFLIKLPLVYGALLIECVRRREWNEKITTDSSSLVEEMATYKEEELQRRKRWLKDMGGSVDLENIDGMALGVEINIQAQKNRWPVITRDDIIEFIQTLRDLGSFGDICTELEQLFKSLDSPTRQQAKRAKAFKNGSVHEATFGRNSLLLRGDDNLLHLMKSEKIKLEEKLKGSESRIRKLEDLLHRQSQISRNSTAKAFGVNNGPSFERHATSPVMNYTSSLSKTQDPLSRRSSTSSRKISMNHESEEKTLAQKVASLEAELGAEKAQSAALQKDAAAKLNAEDELKTRVREAVSTKEDLIGNLEAQQREFDNERRSLEDENSKLKLKLEEAEDELDKVLDNHDHEERARILEGELDKLRQDAADEVQKAQGQIYFLKNDYTMQREKANKLEREVEDRVDENAELQMKLNSFSSRLQNREHAQLDHYTTLKAALRQLSEVESIPDDFSALVDLIELSAKNSAVHLNHVNEMLDAAKAEIVAFKAREMDHAKATSDLQERLDTGEIEVSGLHESLAEQRKQLVRLQGELDDERLQLRELEIGSAKAELNHERLTEKLNDREATIAHLSRELEIAQKHVRESDEQLAVRLSDLEHLRRIHNDGKIHSEARASRAEKVSMRLYLLNASLVKLLEQTGFTVIRQDENMVIQKISKAVSASAVLSDPSGSLNRSISGPLPTKSSIESNIHPDIKWTSNDPEVEASKFSAYIQDVQSFDIDAFTDAIAKRVKEAEHTTRKWQREVRAYRDKAHRAQSEAHEKIAFQSFKEGDLALFLPTRNQATRPWAAFNVGAPHYFLREQDSHKLRTRDWLLARISKVEERVVDLSKSINGLNPASDRRSIGEASDGGASFDDENPFELSDGLRWYLLDAAEEKPGAPINIGISKVTVAAANVDAKGSIRLKKALDGNGATRTLTRSLDSRRNSSNSKKGVVGIASSAQPGDATDTGPAAAGTPLGPPYSLQPHELAITAPSSEPTEEVRKDLLWGP